MKIRNRHFAYFLILTFACCLVPAVASASPAAGETVYFDHLDTDGKLVGKLAEVVQDNSQLCLTAEVSATSTPVSVRNSGASSNRVDILFLGDGYTNSELGQYASEVSQITNSIFQQTPLYEYSSYFNVSRLDLASADSGIDNDPVVGVNKDTVLDSNLWCQGSAENICTNVSKAWQYASGVSGIEHIVVLSNSAQTGGAAYPFSDLSVVASRQSGVANSLLHQLGHSFADLADEYDQGSWPVYTGFEPAEPNATAQTASALQTQRLKWYRWLGADLGASLGGAVSVFEGAMGHQSGVYRPTLNSKMRSLNGVFNLPSIESFIKQIYRLVKPIDDATPSDAVLTGRDTLFVTPLLQRGKALDIQWYMDGVALSGATTSTLRPNDFRLTNGLHVFSVIVADNTPWLRDEDFRSQFMTESRSWTVTIDQHPPVISTQPSNQTVYPGDTALFGVVASGEDLHYQWYRNGVAVSGATLSGNRTPVATRADNGATYYVVISNIAGSVTSNSANLTVGNRAPTISVMSSMQLVRGESRAVPSIILDADRDALNTSVAIESDGVATGATVSINSSNVITVQAGSSYLGTFTVRISTSDGLASVSQTFTVTVVNQAPSLGVISDKRLHWKIDALVVPLNGADADAETLTYSAALEPLNSAPVTLSVSGRDLTVNPADNYLGIFAVRATVSDGRASASRVFSVEVYNSAPVITPIADQSMHWKRDSISVPVVATDPDGESLTYSAGLAPGQSAPVSIQMSGSSVIVNPDAEYQGSFVVRVQVSDGALTAQDDFAVSVFNQGPALAAIPDQRLHWIKDDTRTIALPGSDPDGEPLSYSAEVTGNPDPMPVLSIQGNQLTIDPALRFIGKFGVKVTATDGQLTASRAFTVTTFNSAPDLEPICNIAFHSSEAPYQLTLQATDPDDEPLTFEAFSEAYQLPYILDQVHNFAQPSSGWNFNAIGLSEKYLVGDKHTANRYWYMLLPNGELYEFRGSVDKSTLLGQVPEAVYRNPQLLIDVPVQSASPAVDLSVTNNIVQINPHPGFNGTFVLRARASDEQLFDEESCLVTVYGSSVRVGALDPIRMHWREESAAVTLGADLATGRNSSAALWSVSFTDVSQAYSFDQNYNFRTDFPRSSYTADNSAGWNEKYLLGTIAGSLRLFSLLPNGELYLCSGAVNGGTVVSSTKLAQLLPIYYRDPSLLMHAPSSVAPPIDLSISGNRLTITPARGFVGRTLLTISATADGATDVNNVVLDVYDNAPAIQETDPLQLNWNAGTATVALAATDADSLDLANLEFSAQLGGETTALFALRQYSLSVDMAALMTNRDGWREKHLRGIIDGQSHDLVLLPSSALYLWNGSVATSQLLARLPANYYDLPTLLNSLPANPETLPDVGVAVAGNHLGLTLPAQYFVGSFLVRINVTDGNQSDQWILPVTVSDNAPTLQPIAEQRIHWRTDELQLPMVATEPEGEVMSYTAQANRYGGGNLPVDLRWQSNVLGINPRDRYLGAFYVTTGVADARHLSQRQFGVTVYNTPPTLVPVDALTMSYLQDRLDYQLGASDLDSADSSRLTFKAYLGTPAHLARQLDQLYNFSISSSDSAATDVYGYGEKYLSGTRSGAAARFLILANGELYDWTGSFPVASPIAHLPSSYYSNPAALVDVPVQASLPNVDVSVSGSTLTVDPQATRYQGVFPITIEVTDGQDYATTTVNVTSANNSPVLSQPADVERHWSAFPHTVSLTARDSDGDPLTYTAAIDNPTNGSVAVSGNSVTITPRAQFVGDIVVTASVTDGMTTDRKSFRVRSSNTAPVINLNSPLNLGWKESATIQLQISDADGDPLTITATPDSASASKITAQLSNRTLTITSRQPFVGSAAVIVQASDGPSTSTGTLVINYTNRAPSIDALRDQSLNWKLTSKTIQLRGTDPDGDALSYSAVVTENPSAATVSVANDVLTVRPAGRGETFVVTAYVSDGVNSASTSFRVNIVDNSPRIAVIANQTVTWQTRTVVVPISATDADNDALTYSAAADGTTIPMDLSFSGSTLTIRRRDNSLGTNFIQVTVSDGFASAVTRFSLTVTNTPPELMPVADQIMSYSTPRITVALDGTDADGDTLTYSASLVSAQRLAFELDQKNNFDRRNGSSNDNTLRLDEKYLYGTKNTSNTVYTFVIFPNGRVYEWKGALTRSIYLGVLPAEYYLDPMKLVDVPTPAAPADSAAVSISGKTITITPQSNYTGRFYVRGAVTDGLSTTATIFSVTVQEPVQAHEPGDGDGDGEDDRCETGHEHHHGDYCAQRAVSFVAEGRVGDSATSPGSQTHEVSVSHANSGNYGSGETASYQWNNNRKVDFQLSYNKQNSLVTFTLAGVTVRHTATVTTRLTDVFIRTQAGRNGTRVLLERLKLNGVSIGEDDEASDSEGSVNTLQVTARTALRGDFTLEGQATMQFDSDRNRGVRNSELSFQISVGNVEGDDEDDQGCDNDEGEGRKVTICHVPAGDWTKAHTIRVGVSALEAHLAHGDIIGECPGSPADPGDGGGTCEDKRIITSPNYVLWNSFLGMLNILELTNSTEAELPVRVSFYSIRGDLTNQRWIVVPAKNQLDLIVNDLPGFVANSYGVIKLEFTGSLDGRMMFYKLLPNGVNYDFAYGVPLADANFGNTAVSFNTFQPSLLAAERNNMVANWLSIVNLDSQPQSFTIYTYDITGRLIMRRERELQPFGRDDMDGGHDLAGPNVVGFHKIVPHNVTAEYIAQLTRFGGNSPRGFAPSEYKFAFPLSAKLGQSDPIYVPMSNKFGEYNWIEVINILDHGVGATLNYFGQDGRVLESEDAWIEANAQVHFDARAHLNSGEVGYAEVVPRESFSLVAQSMGYMRDPATGSVTSVYGSQARRALPCLQSGTYNLFLGMQNWLLVSNTTNASVEATIQVTGPNLFNERNITLAPRASVHIPIHQQSEFGARANTYGLLAVKPKISSVRLFAEVMRLRFDSTGKPEFSAPIPVR